METEVVDLGCRHGGKNAHAAKPAIMSGATGKHTGNLKRKAETQPTFLKGFLREKGLERKHVMAV